ncbi:MAG: hypothetical protein JEZ07_14530 [Phycisphaerae bacterium]|nr:hypothetical protein [Phycisphaerae bacterium]
MKNIKVLLVLLLMVSFVKAAGKLGDHADGSQGSSSHSYLFKLLNAEGLTIDPFTETEPFSVKMTCGNCHDYDTICTGMHFNAGQTADDGRAGEPWIFVDSETGTQLPISYRKWKGVQSPENLMIPPDFVSQFGRFAPGNMKYDEDFDSGKPIRTDVNCLTCHNADPIQSHMKYAMQMKKGMFTTVTTASSNLGSVTGDVFDPAVQYNPNFFDKEGKVNFNITRHVSNESCLNCHSTAHVDQTGEKRWTLDADIHIKSGMSCVDCHRNGLNHATVRGYEGETLGIDNIEAGTLSCAGCHMGEITQSKDSELEVKNPIAGRFGAPYPTHAGIPSVHFKKLSCTACHSGRFPGEKTGLVKTSRGHFLGLLDSKKVDQQLPHIYSPVLTEGHDGKLAPHKMVWPAFWAWKNAENELTVIDPEMMPSKFEKPADGSWPEITKEDIAMMLATLQEDADEGQAAVYICNGKMHSVDKNGKLLASEHEQAEPYKWAVGHNVRPGQQSLGANYSCDDCHSTKSGFFFGKVAVDGPLKTDDIEMASLQNGVDRSEIYAFNLSLVLFKSIMKYFSLLCCAVLALILLTYLMRALEFVLAVFNGRIPVKEEKEYELMPLYCKARKWLYPIVWALAVVLGLTGFVKFCSINPSLWLSMIHCTAAPMFIAFVTLATIFWAADNRFGRRDIFSQYYGGQKVCFWAAICLALIATFSSAISMFEIFSPTSLDVLLWIHIISTILLTLCGIVHLYFIWVAKTHEK